MASTLPLGPGVHVLERGWLSSNNIVLDDGDAAVLVDSGHCAHAAQTVALLRRTLGARPLRTLINTHLHSDHCGGNAALQREWAVPVQVPEASARAVRDWDEHALGHAAMGQRSQRFEMQCTLHPGQALVIGARTWLVLAAPGHDPLSVMLYDAEHGVLISADALWENGFGLVFPELEGRSAFDDVAATLERISELPVRWVIPGHGAPFVDAAGALARAHGRLARMRADPARHLRHGARVILKYHLMEEQRQSLDAVRQWLAATPLLRAVWSTLGRPGGSYTPWCEQLLQASLADGLLVLRDGIVHDT